MEKFWIIAVANECNNINERFYTYEDAVKEARKRASVDPSKIYNVLELKGYAEGELSISSNYDDEEEIIVIEVDKGDSINVHIKFEDSKGEPLDLKGCGVQFVVLPGPNSPDEAAMYNKVKYYTDDVPLTSDTFTSNKVNFVLDSSVTKETGTFWYQVRIIYNAVPPTKDPEKPEEEEPSVPSLPEETEQEETSTEISESGENENSDNTDEPVVDEEPSEPEDPSNPVEPSEPEETVVYQENKFIVR